MANTITVSKKDKLNLLSWLTNHIASHSTTNDIEEKYLEEFDRVLSPFLTDEGGGSGSGGSNTGAFVFKMSDMTKNGANWEYTHNLDVDWYTRVDILSNGLNGEDLNVKLYQKVVTDNAGVISLGKNKISFSGWDPNETFRNTHSIVLEYSKTP